jgi:Putative adhesin
MLTRPSLARFALLATFVFAAAAAAPSMLRADDSFDRTLTVSGPVHLELSNASGNVSIRGTASGKVHVHGKVTGNWSLFGSSGHNIQDVVANPPIEQSGDTIRIGKNVSWIKNVSIEYDIEVPKETDIDASNASGGITIDDIRGPVKASSASGYLHVYRVERDTQLSAASGSIEAENIGGFLRISNASGDITATNVKGDVKLNSASGSIRLQNAGDRVEASAASGSIEVQGVSSDLKVHAISGTINVEGDPSASRLWELKSVSGSVDVRVPANAGFLLSAEATSGDIRTNIPVVIEEQGKHSLRAHVGNSSGRIEVHTVSGSINVRGGA